MSDHNPARRFGLFDAAGRLVAHGTETCAVIELEPPR
jgi:hypothetical protein